MGRVIQDPIPFLVLFVFGYWYTALLSLLQGTAGPGGKLLRQSSRCFPRRDRFRELKQATVEQNPVCAARSQLAFQSPDTFGRFARFLKQGRGSRIGVAG